MSRAKKLMESLQPLNEGSITEYDDWAKKHSKGLLPLIKLTNKNYEIRDQVQRSIVTWMENAGKLKGMAGKLREDEFPEDPRSSEGKLGFISIQEYVLRDLKEALDKINISVG